MYLEWPRSEAVLIRGNTSLWQANRFSQVRHAIPFDGALSDCQIRGRLNTHWQRACPSSIIFKNKMARFKLFVMWYNDQFDSVHLYGTSQGVPTGSINSIYGSEVVLDPGQDFGQELSVLAWISVGNPFCFVLFFRHMTWNIVLGC